MTVKAVSACVLFESVVGWRKKNQKKNNHDLDTDGLNTTLSLETSIVWVGIILLTPEFLNY